jgi:tetratricopeptide (TPR) repeat protein
VSSRASIIELHKWCLEAERTLPLGKAINKLSARMRKSHGEDRYTLGFWLKNLLARAGRDTEALAIMDEMVELYPDDVRIPISKATHYLYFQEDPQEALNWIEMALRRAHHTGFFRREALGVKARILVQLGKGKALSQVLEEIMALKIKKEIPDIGRERDFVDHAPPGLISKKVLAAYNKFRPKRAGDSDGNMRPEWTYPDDAE